MFFVVIAIGAAIMLAMAMIVGFPTDEPETASQGKWGFLHESLVSQRHGYHPGVSEIKEIGRFPLGSLNWFQDDGRVESTVIGLQAFTRCSGDSDKPTCVLLLGDLNNSHAAHGWWLDDLESRYQSAWDPMEDNRPRHQVSILSEITFSGPVTRVKSRGERRRPQEETHDCHRGITTRPQGSQEPCRVIVVFDFPVDFAEAAARRLLTLVRNGPRSQGST